MPKDSLPPFIVSDGMAMAAFDAVIIIGKILIATDGSLQTNICSALRERYGQHQD